MQNSNIINQLKEMKNGEQKDIVFNNGLLRSSKTIEKESENKFLVHDFTSGWNVAVLDLQECSKYVTGELTSLNLDWK